MQENNAIAKVNLINNKIEFIKGIPFKSFQECKVDNDYDKVVNLKYSNILSSYQPDAIVLLDNKKNYFLIAGEGDGVVERAEAGGNEGEDSQSRESVAIYIEYI